MPHSIPAPRRWAALAVLCCFSWLAVHGLAADSAPARAFDIPAGDAVATLKQFSTQADSRVLYSIDAVQGVRTNGVKGSLTPKVALEQMVAGTPLGLVLDDKTGALGLQRRTPSSVPEKNVPRAAEVESSRRPQNADSRPAAGDDTLVLSPFSVNSSKDVGYLARDTLAGTRMNTSLRDVAAQVSIMTPEFLEDVGAVTLDDALRYSLNIESTKEYYDVTSSNNSTLTTAPINGNNRVRGLGQSTPTHDFFGTIIPIDVYNSERFTFVYGPNAILFGSGNPSGNTDTSFKRARVNQASYGLDLRADTNDSWRTSFDLNQPILKNKLALRVAGVKMDNKEARKPNFDRQERIFATLQVEPFKWMRGRLYYEDVHRDRMPLRNTVITDAITPWVQAGKPLFNNGVGQALPANVNVAGQAGFNPVFQLYNNANSPIVAYGNTAGASPAGVQYANTTVVTRSYDTAAATPDNFDRSLSDASLFPLDANFAGEGLQNKMHGDIRGFTVELNPLKNLYFEIGANEERFIQKFVDLFPFGTTELRVDPNMFLPDRVTRNPNVGRYYLTSGVGAGASFYYFRSARASASYELNFTEKPGWQKWLGKHRMALLRSRDNTRDGRGSSNLTITNNPASLTAILPKDAAGNLVSPADNYRTAQRSPTIRYYLGNPQDAGAGGSSSVKLPFNPWAPGMLPGTDWQVTTLDSPLGTQDVFANSRRYLDSNVQTIQSFFLKDRVVLTYGRRVDDSESYSISPTNALRTGTNGGTGVGNIAGYAWWYNQYRGGTYTLDQVRSGKTELKDVVVHPFRWLSLFYNQSNTHDAPASVKLNLDGSSTEVGDGVGKNYGITLSLLNDNLMVRINRQKTIQGQGINNTLRAAGGLGGINPFRDVVSNLERSLAVRGAPPSVKFANFSEAMKSVGASAGANPFREIYDVVSDRVSSGTEVELIANPTPSWRVSASFARTDATESNIAHTWFDFIQDRLPVLAQYKDQLVYNSTTQTIGAAVIGNAINSWNFIRASEGRRVDQQRRDRFNVTSRYSFLRGPLKGFFAGGSYLWRASAVLGYGSKIAKGSELAFTQGFIGPNDTLAISDIDKPISGPAYTELDGFFGYSRRIWQNKIQWRVQLNIRNLFDDRDRIPQRVLSTGEVAVFTLPDTRTFILTNSFLF
jgi:iron complex outermembrane recepter protein